MKPSGRVNLRVFTVRARQRLRAGWLACGLGLAGVAAMAQPLPSLCGPLANAYGPFDYRTDKDKLTIVDIHHFTPEVENLVRGKEGYLGSDLDYTLRAFPNHHRALAAMMRYGKKLNTLQVPNSNYTVECYFRRSLAFRPDDTTVRMMFAIFLAENKRMPEALQHLEYVKQSAGDDAIAFNKLGLVYLEIGQPRLALQAAHKAMELGFPGTALKDRLIAAQQWAEPASAPQ